MTDHRAELKGIKTFPSLIKYLRDEMGWPIDSDDFEEITFQYTPEELGIEVKAAAKIEEIKRLRPLSPNQPWGIFFVKFQPKKLPVIALRRMLSAVVVKKRASANKSERSVWQAEDLLFVSNFGEGDERQISFAHFSHDTSKDDLPMLKVLGWDNLDTPLHLDHVAEELRGKLAWPENEKDVASWRKTWSSAFDVRHREVVTTSRELSIRLAELARAIRDRIKSATSIETENGPLTRLMKAFEEALVHDLDTEGFADMYAQTIAYGLLSARIADPHAKTADDFASHMRTNPFLKELMETFLTAGGRKGKAGGGGLDFDELGVSEVVALLDAANMEAVVRDFGDKNPQEDPVIHFYEHFLAAYDKTEKVKRGVFYTPRPVVSFIVRSVDELLRSELGLVDGLADTTTWGEMRKRNKDIKIPDGVPTTQTFIQILDPATGTGTFLVEVIDIIHCTMVAKWEALGHGEKKIRVLWNEYVPKHLLPRLHGYELLMAPYAIAHMKIGLKLYETGYRFGCDERARVFLTNALEPPSDAQIRNSALPALAHEAQVVNEIKRKQRFTVVIGNPPYSRTSYNVGEHADKLVVAYKDHVRNERNIQPLSDDYIKFIGLGQNILTQTQYGVFGMITNNTFLSGRIHRGIRQELLTCNSLLRVVNLHGSQKVGFIGAARTTDENVFDILQGVSVILITKGCGGSAHEYVDLIGSRAEKYVSLLNGNLKFVPLDPQPDYFLLVPWNMSGPEYQMWPSISELVRFQSVAGKPGDDDLLISFDRAAVIPKLRKFKKALAAPRMPKLTEAGEKFKAFSPTSFEDRRVIAYAYRPFDIRYTYYDPRMWTRPLARLYLCVEGSPILLTTKLVKDGSFSHVFVTRLFPDVIFLSNTSSVNCYAFPRRILQDGGGLRLGGAASNYNFAVIRGRFKRPFSDEVVFSYIYAVLHSPAYRDLYTVSLRLDFPRVPIPNSESLLLQLSELGAKLVELHLLESSKLGKNSSNYVGPKDPEVTRVGWSNDRVWLDMPATKKDQTAQSGTIGFCNISQEVWDFRIGGYQVCEKWLKDRKGRKLSADDIVHYQKIVVAISETIHLMKEIDEVIEAHGGWPGAFYTEANASSAQPRTRATIIPFPEMPVDKAKPFKNCIPLYEDLKIAAGRFSAPQNIKDAASVEQAGVIWVNLGDEVKPSEDLFIAQVVGESMNRRIPNGSWCLFRARPEGTRQGKVVLARHNSLDDPELAGKYTLKIYSSEKSFNRDGSWRHIRITLKPDSRDPSFKDIEIEPSEGEKFEIVAELIRVLSKTDSTEVTTTEQLSLVD